MIVFCLSWHGATNSQSPTNGDTSAFFRAVAESNALLSESTLKLQTIKRRNAVGIQQKIREILESDTLYGFHVDGKIRRLD